MNKGTVSIHSGKPLEFTNVEDVPDGAQADPVREAVAAYLKAYKREARTLLTGRLAGLADVAPPHIKEICDAFVVRCTDGMLVRYDRSPGEKPTLRLGTPVGRHVVPTFSNAKSFVGSVAMIRAGSALPPG